MSTTTDSGIPPATAQREPATPNSHTAPDGLGASFRVWLRRAYPTFLVLLALGGVAVIGHRTGWSFKGLAAFFGKPAAPQDDWCKEHGVPESICVECRKGLLPKPPTFGWCDKHKVYDCPLEHPEVAQLHVTPEITDADFARAQRALDFTDRPGNSKKCKLHPRRIQVASPAALKKLGLD